MQEAALSLMQMAKTVMSLDLLWARRLPYVSILTDPTTGGVTASFAALADVIFAEPGALIASPVLGSSARPSGRSSPRASSARSSS